MKSLAILAALAINFGTASCTHTQPPTLRDEPQDITADGPYTQASSGMIFPEQMGPFRRQLIRQHDTAGENVSVGYWSGGPDHYAMITVYVYPAPIEISVFPAPMVKETPRNLVEGHFQSVKADVLRAWPGMRLVSEEKWTLKQEGRSYEGLRAMFEGPGHVEYKPTQLVSYAYLFTHGKWFIKYRVTFPSSHKAMAEPAVENFMTSLTWPTGTWYVLPRKAVPFSD